MIRNRYNYPTPPIRDIKGKEIQTRNNWTVMETLLAESQTDSYFPTKWPNGYPKQKHVSDTHIQRRTITKINHDRRTALEPAPDKPVCLFGCPFYQNKNQRSWALHILGISRCSLYFPKFHICRVKCMNVNHYVSTFPTSHIALPCDRSRLHGCTIRSPLCSLRNTKYQFPILYFFSNTHCQVLNSLHENAFCSLHTSPPYLMSYSTFCKVYTETWGLGSFQYHLPTLTIQPNLFHVKDWRSSTLRNSCGFQLSGH